MNRETTKLYKRMRKYRNTAAEALRDAKVLRQFNRLADHGFVRIDVKPDPDPDMSYLDQDCFNDTSQAKRQTQALRERIERDGSWGTIGEYRIEDGNAWEHADSCWGHQGYDDPSSPFENAYVIDHMSAAIDALKTALRERFCSNCGHRAA